MRARRARRCAPCKICPPTKPPTCLPACLPCRYEMVGGQCWVLSPLCFSPTSAEESESGIFGGEPWKSGQLWGNTAGTPNPLATSASATVELGRLEVTASGAVLRGPTRRQQCGRPERTQSSGSNPGLTSVPASARERDKRTKSVPLNMPALTGVVAPSTVIAVAVIAAHQPVAPTTSQSSRLGREKYAAQPCSCCAV